MGKQCYPIRLFFCDYHQLCISFMPFYGIHYFIKKILKSYKVISEFFFAELTMLNLMVCNFRVVEIWRFFSEMGFGDAGAYQ